MEQRYLDCDVTLPARGFASPCRENNTRHLAIVSEAVDIAPVHGVAATHAVVTAPGGGVATFTGSVLVPDTLGEWTCSITVGGVMRKYHLIVAHASVLALAPIAYELSSGGVPMTDRARLPKRRCELLQAYLNDASASISGFTSATPTTGLSGISWGRFGG